MSSYLLAKACIAAGVPPGVIGMVYGEKAALADLVFKNPAVKAIAYAGDAEKGKELAETYNNPSRKTSFVLGAKNPAIIFADCNFHKMIVETLRSSFSNNGQHPYSTSRLLVERTIYESFKEELVKRTQFLSIGDSLSSSTDLGAIISKEKLERLLAYVALAELEGGKILCGGKAIDLGGDFSEGFFFRPVIIEGLEPNSRINQEDIFGPIVTITPFDNDEDVLQLANSTPYGKAASIWTQNTGRASKVAERLNAGMIWINSWMLKEDRASFTPLDASGNAAVGGMEALHFFTTKKTIGQPL
jgi:aminomuconate-semialdehyde/2-hydroxymuconate-6-semialdehyde dehydrogenase